MSPDSHANEKKESRKDRSKYALLLQRISATGRKRSLNEQTTLNTEKRFMASLNSSSEFTSSLRTPAGKRSERGNDKKKEHGTGMKQARKHAKAVQRQKNIENVILKVRNNFDEYLLSDQFVGIAHSIDQSYL